MRAFPVVMIAYNRPDLFRRALELVAVCEGVGERDIRVFVDGPRREADGPLVAACAEVAEEFGRTRLPRLRVIRRERNLGCQENIVRAIADTLDEFGAAIVVEDDIFVSRTFLRYMDEALALYADDDRIWCVNGFRSPYLRRPKTGDVYLSPRNMCWGWGTWKDRFEAVDFNMKTWSAERDDPAFRARLDRAGIDLYGLLEMQSQGTLRSWAVQCSYHMVRNGLFAVEPRFSLTKNGGFGTVCEHCRENEPVYARQKAYDFRPVLPRRLEVDEAFLRCFRDVPYSRRWLVRAKRKFRRLVTGWICRWERSRENAKWSGETA